MMSAGINPLSENTIREAFETMEALNKRCFISGNVIQFDVGGPYKIAIERCDSPVKILDWIDHLCNKPWMTKELIQRFIQVACETHNIEYQDAR